MSQTTETDEINELIMSVSKHKKKMLLHKLVFYHTIIHCALKGHKTLGF